jgi:hypothetical protein
LPSPDLPFDPLTLLIDDELARRDSAGVARRIHNSRFEDVCDLRDLDFTDNPEIPRARRWELATGQFIPPRRDLQPRR